MTARTLPLRAARSAEACYALVALLFLTALPLPPQGAALVTWVHLLGTSMLAGTLAWRLRRPNRASWYVAALLSAYVLLQAAPIAGAVLRTLGRDGLGVRAAVESIALLPAACQAVVAVCLYRLRGLRNLGT